MVWIAIIAYLCVLIPVCLIIMFETRSSTKSVAYLLLCICIRVFGIVFYFTFVINYWKTKLYTNKKSEDEKRVANLGKKVPHSGSSVKPEELSGEDTELASM